MSENLLSMTSKSTDILLVGKTGIGKSATANTIVGYKGFKASGSSESVTKATQFEYGEIDGRILKVVDSPGVCDTSLDNREGIQLVVTAMKVAIAANPAGYHAIILVWRWNDRFTKENVETVEILKSIFGENFIRYHGIVLMTYGDNFPGEVDIPFDEWIKEQTGKLKDLVNECSGRAILFDNRTKDIRTKREQNRKLLKMIDRLSGTDIRYTSEIFNKAKESRESLIKKSKKPQLDEESLIECSLITRDLSHVSYQNPESDEKLLKQLQERAEVLEQNIIKQDSGTNALNVVLKLAQQLKLSISESMRAVNEILTLKKQREIELKMQRAKLEEDTKNRMEAERLREVEIEQQMKELIKQKNEEMKKIELKREAVKEEQKLTWKGVISDITVFAINLVKSYFRW